MKSNVNNHVRIVILSFLFSVFWFLLGSLNTFENLRGSAFSIFEEVAISVVEKIQIIEEMSFVFNNISTVRDENKDLRGKLKDLQDELTEKSVQLEDVEYIIEKGLADFDREYELIPVRVLLFDQKNRGKLYLNKGRSHNIEEEDIVVLGKFIVAEIDEVYDNYSTAENIFGTDTRLNVISINSKTRGILKGDISGQIEVIEILNDSPLSEKDQFVTEGKEGMFPYGLYVGTVSRIIGSPAEPTKIAILENTLSLQSLDRLFVMNMK